MSSYYRVQNKAYCANCVKFYPVSELINENQCPVCRTVVRLRPRNNSARHKDPRPFAEPIKEIRKNQTDIIFTMPKNKGLIK